MYSITQPHLRAHLKTVFATCLLSGLFVLESQADQFISAVNTDKAMYSPGIGVTLYVDITNSTASTFSGSVSAVVTHLGYAITNLPAQTISGLGAHAVKTNSFAWLPPTTDFQGYLVSVSVLDQNSNVLDSGSSAVDVSSDWAKFPRYGYVAHYDIGLNAGNVMLLLKNYHINGVEFYDWQWKHHIPYNSGATWPDVANRTISRPAVLSLIVAAHSYNMMAMNYNLYGGAYDNYASDGSGVALSMGIFSGPTPSIGNQINYPLSAGWATSTLYEMNNRDSGWQNYIYSREQTVFSNFAFDGWHIDSLGQHTVYDYTGTAFNLDDYNPQFINNAKTTLGRRVTFNTVDAGGENQVAQSANVDFVYSELWSGNPNYLSFKQRVDNVRSFGSKAVVFPAYMNYSNTSGFFNEASVRLADAAIFACGASHVELGDGDKMLHTEYFPNDTSVLMNASLTAAMHAYYDFLVGYENLLRGDTVSANNTATITGVTTSTTGSAGTVWAISRKTLGFNVMHLVNLLNNTSTAWRDDNATYPAPPTRSNLAVKMYYTGPLGGGKLWWASPDSNFGAASELTYTTGSDGVGNYVNFTLPQLQYWDMVWLETRGTNAAQSQFQAENYDSMAGVATEACADAGGGSDIGSVNNTTGDSYVAFNNIDFASGCSSVLVRAASASANGTIEFHTDSAAGPVLATAPVGNTGGWQTWKTIVAPVSGASGLHKLFAVFENAASNLNWFKFNVLPAPWAETDVGDVSQPGYSDCSSGVFAVTGSGADIWGTADAFHYVYQPATGDAVVTAHVSTQQNTDPWAKAGPMFRASSSPDAVFAGVVVTPGNGINFQWRTSPAGQCANAQGAGISVPVWLKLVRSGSSFTAFYSSNGSSWTQIGSSTNLAAMTGSALAGLAVTAHNNTTACTAAFDNLSLNQAPVLAAVSNRTLLAGATLLIINSASDADVPAQALTYSLLSAPAGASIDPSSGIFTWRPTIAQSPSVQSIGIKVADNGTPVLSATQSFSVTVQQPAYPVMTATLAGASCLNLNIAGDAGPDYTIQVSTNLVVWDTAAASNSPAMPWSWADTNLALFPHRFYRVLLGP